MERKEKERLNIPVAAFQFLEQQDFKAFLNETMDKSVFYKVNPGEEKTQGIGYLLIEMFKIRRNINKINMHPQMAKEYIESSKVLANSKVLELRKYSKNSQSSNVKMTIRRR